MTEFLICARPLIITVSKYRLTLFKMVKKPVHFVGVMCVYSWQENYCVQNYLCYLGCI